MAGRRRKAFRIVPVLQFHTPARVVGLTVGLFKMVENKSRARWHVS
jgi:hypothetical protein